MRAIGSHHSAKPISEDWITPPNVIAALGGAPSFDLDPCASLTQPWPCAQRSFTRADDGLARPWGGRVWLNPPYSTAEIAKWLSRIAEHDRGTALIFARTETDAFYRLIWERAAAVLFIRGRLHFHYPDGTRAKANAGAPSVLVAYGSTDADILAFSQIEGQFVPLKIPRSILGAVIATTWREALAAWLSEQGGPVHLSDIYRAFADHPKAKGKAHVREKIRQTLKRGKFERVAPGFWDAPKSA